MFIADKKLKRLLLFSILIALAMPLINVFLIYPKFTVQLERNIEDSALRLAHHIERELQEVDGWSFVHDGGTPSPEAIHLLQNYKNDFELRKMKIFSASGLTVYSTEESDVGKINNKDYFHQIVAKGRLFSKLVKKQTPSLEGKMQQADVIETYVPIMKAGQFMAAFELYYDITKQIKALDRVIFFASILPFAVSGFLLLMLVWGMRSLDKSITVQKCTEQKLKGSLDQLAEQKQRLDQQHSELIEAHDQLKMAQSQILQREKMASVGQLAAGVAHEINNPMGFIAGNLRSLQKYMKKFLGYQTEVQKLYKQLTEAQQAEIKQLRKGAKIDFMLEDIPDLLEESLDGADRVKDIVQNLKSFSHVDAAEYKPSDLNECLESTIKIIWNELKYKVTLDKDYGDLPLVPCYPQQLNQVFMNILLNASHAIETAGVVEMKTWADHEKAYVTIRDNGCGIPEELHKRIFEPFFTTKDVGQGTGLGMSIAYDIISGHQGGINVQSTPGEGTVFTIYLPLQGVAAQSGLSPTSNTL